MKVRIAGMPGKKVRITGLPKAQAGGNIPVTQGLPDSLHHLANVEAEGGEVYQNQAGGFTKISDQAPSHEDGGVMIPDAHRVLEDTSTDRKDKFSQKLKMSPNEVKTIFGVKVKSPVSHAQAFERVTKDYDKQRDEVNRSQSNIDDLPKIDKAAANSAKYNFKTRAGIPSNEDIFNTLFEHQEAIKQVHDIPNDGGAKYGGYTFKPKAQAGGTPAYATPEYQREQMAKMDAEDEASTTPQGIQPYKGGRTKAGSTTPMGNSNQFQYSGGLDAFKKAWAPYIDMSQYNNVKDAQAASYGWLVNNQPDIAANVWKDQGLTAKGRSMMDPRSKDYNPEFAKVANQVFDSSGKVKEGIKLTPEVLSSLSPAYGDNMLGIRSVTPSPATETTGSDGTPPAPVQNPTQPAPIPRQNGPTVTPRISNNKPSQFNDPNHWYDVAPGMAELVDSMSRDPELYNPIQLHQLKYKLLNPTAALEANQSDFEASQQTLEGMGQGSGAAAANLSNLSAQKYKANNQILGEYENANTGITNKEIDYNTNVRDRQSMADANSREQFYTNVLKGRDNQRMQKLQAIQDISREQQLHARQNKSGNMILKMTPAFDQNAEYNGYQYHPTLPNDMPQGQIPGPVSKTKPSRTTTTTTFKVGNKSYRVVNNGDTAGQ